MKYEPSSVPLPRTVTATFLPLSVTQPNADDPTEMSDAGRVIEPSFEK